MTLTGTALHLPLTANITTPIPIEDDPRCATRLAFLIVLL